MRNRKIKLVLLLAAAVVLAAATVWVISVRNSALKILADEQNRLAKSELIPFERAVLSSYAGNDIKIIQNTKNVRDLAAFQNSLYAATSGGLVRLSPEGELQHHYTVLDGLPESDLTALTVFHETLFIGTRTKGLVAFDGERFTGYRWTDRDAQTVTSLATGAGDLLIGTFAGGLIRFDGANFTEVKANGERITAITRIVNNHPQLYVGTFNNGLWTYENNTWTHVTTADGLPSNRIVGIALKGDKLYIATDFGLAAREAGAVQNIAVIPSLSGIAESNGRLLLTKDDGELFSYEKSLVPLSEQAGSANSRLVMASDRLWQVSNNGIDEIDGLRVRPLTKAAENSLTENLISALALDASMNLWVGTFRNGIDVLSRIDGKTRHIETDAVREVNFLEADGNNIKAATTSGLIELGSNLSVQKNFTKADNLPSNSVTHFSDTAIATAKGLAFLEPGHISILSTVQGLPSNSVYTILKVNDRLYVGTLGGLAEISEHRVVRTFKDSNSDLKTNWVTSLCAAGGRIFIGTYGGGVFELLPSGDIHSFEPEIGKFVVNPNAMFSDGERLYIGTLTGAKILDLRTLKWQTMDRYLPSANIMSITASESAVYFGTSSGVARIDKSFFNKHER